jgi:hypothetical protein
MGSIPAIPNTRSMPLLLCCELFNEASLLGTVDDPEIKLRSEGTPPIIRDVRADECFWCTYAADEGKTSTGSLEHLESRLQTQMLPAIELSPSIILVPPSRQQNFSLASQENFIWLCHSIAARVTVIQWLHGTGSRHSMAARLTDIHVPAVT